MQEVADDKACDLVAWLCPLPLCEGARDNDLGSVNWLIFSWNLRVSYEIFKMQVCADLAA